MNNLAELNEESPYFDCQFSVKVEDDSFAVVDLPKEQGYKFHLEHIDYEHDGCEDALMRIAWAKFRDDSLSQAQKYEKLQLKKSNADMISQKQITLGTVGELNQMADEDANGHVVV